MMPKTAQSAPAKPVRNASKSATNHVAPSGAELLEITQINPKPPAQSSHCHHKRSEGVIGKESIFAGSTAQPATSYYPLKSVATTKELSSGSASDSPVGDSKPTVAAQMDDSMGKRRKAVPESLTGNGVAPVTRMAKAFL